MVLGVPRFCCVLLLVGVLVLVIGTVGCGGGAAASTTPAGNTTPQPADLAITPTTVDFAQQTINTASGAQSVTLRNPGTTSVEISSITVDGDFTQNNNCGTSIGPSSTCTVAVVFGPAMAGERTGTLQITEKSGKVHRVPVKGSGATPGQLTPNPVSLDFGSVNTGQSSVQTVTISNTGGTSFTISGVQTAGTGFSASSTAVPFTISPGATSTISVTFAPTTIGSVTGSLYIRNSTATVPLTLPLAGTGVGTGQLTVNPTALDFGSVTVGQTSTKSVTLSNTGAASLTLSSVTTASVGYSVNGITVPFTLAAGASTSFSVTFSPLTSGSATGGVSISSSAATQPLTVSLTGSGATPGRLSANPTSIDFGSVYVGQSSSKSVTLSNTGAASLTITGISTEGPGFSASASVPFTLAVGASTSFNVMFTPSNSGAASGNIYISDSIRAQDVTVPLSGTAASAASHSVSLSWVGSASTVAGYNVYRATQSGGPYTRINTTTQNFVSYDDDAVQNGTTYYYVVTAVDQSSAESAYSNEASAQVPTT